MMDNQNVDEDLVTADRYELDELRAAAFGESSTLSRQLAVALLGRKQYPGKADDMGRLLTNEDEESRLRIMAAAELGKMGTPAAMATLSAALDVAEPRVLQSVVEATAAAGDAEAIPRLRTLRRRKQEPLAEAAAWGSQLLALRMGERSQSLPQPPARKLMRVDPKRAEAVAVRRLDDDALETISVEVSRGPLKLDLSTSSGSRARCGDRDFALLFTSAFLEDPQGALKRKTIVMGVAELHHVEHRSWDLRYLVVAQPNPDEIQLHVLTQGGELAFYGHARIEQEGSVAFSIRAVDRPGAVPAVIEGSFVGDGLRIERFDSEPTGRRRVSSGIRERTRR